MKIKIFFLLLVIVNLSGCDLIDNIDYSKTVDYVNQLYLNYNSNKSIDNKNNGKYGKFNNIILIEKNYLLKRKKLESEYLSKYNELISKKVDVYSSKDILNFKVAVNKYNIYLKEFSENWIEISDELQKDLDGMDLEKKYKLKYLIVSKNRISKQSKNDNIKIKNIQSTGYLLTDLSNTFKEINDNIGKINIKMDSYLVKLNNIKDEISKIESKKSE